MGRSDIKVQLHGGQGRIKIFAVLSIKECLLRYLAWRVCQSNLKRIFFSTGRFSNGTILCSWRKLEMYSF